MCKALGLIPSITKKTKQKTALLCFGLSWPSKTDWPLWLWVAETPAMIQWGLKTEVIVALALYILW
jgi:hypothetical protein